MKYNHTWEEVENAGRLYNVEFSIDFDVTPYRPAKTNCDPDDGHPAEGGEVVIDALDVLSVEMVDVGMIEKVSDLEKLYWKTRFLKDVHAEDFAHELREHAAQDAEAAREAEEDSRYDHEREGLA